MTAKEKIQEAYQTATDYPSLVKKLTEVGVTSYTVEVSGSIIMYRLATGETLVHTEAVPARKVATEFSEALCLMAIQNNLAAKTDYATFMNELAGAGVRVYDANLGEIRKYITYAGIDGFYVEDILA